MPSKTSIQIDGKLLRRLHHLQHQQEDLQGQLNRGPKAIAAAEVAIEKAIAAWQGAKDDVRAATVIADEKQLQLAQREDRVKDLEGKLNTAATNKEFSTLKEQIAADKKANEVLSDEILEVLEKIERLETEVATAAEAVEASKSVADQRREEVTARMEVVRGDLEDMQSKLAEEEAAVPASVRVIYDRLIAALGVEALAGVEGNSCGNCNHVLRTQLIDELALGNMIQCPSCNAILYPAE